jgi:cobalt transporter subunit CbtA
MLGRIILNALFAGLLAGAVLAGLEYVRLAPLIAAAEKYESPEGAALAEASKKCVENMPGMKMCGDEARPAWEPEMGFERTFYTSAASLLAGAGFAIFLVGVSLVTNIPITTQNGLLWGLCGFLAVTVAPAAGLPPEPPGLPVADLYARQLWWVATIAATALAIYLIAIKSAPWAMLTGVVLISLPHIVGAPAKPETATLLPAAIASHFTANAISCAAVFWATLGFALGKLLSPLQKDIATL